MLLMALTGAARAEDITIATLGDSLIQGYGLRPDDGLVPQLERWLVNAGATVTLINAGVSGDTSAGGLSRIDWTLTPEVDGVIVALGGNDLLRGLDPDLTRANLDGILQRARDADVPAALIPMESLGNYGPDYKEAFDSLYPDLAEKHGIPLLPSLFSALGTDGAEMASLIQPDGIHPNARGVEQITQTLGPALLPWVRALGACEAGCAPAM